MRITDPRSQCGVGLSQVFEGGAVHAVLMLLLLGLEMDLFEASVFGVAEFGESVGGGGWRVRRSQWWSLGQ
jgi:hypothetical protein